MKKLIYTIVLAAGFQFAHGQQVVGTFFMNFTSQTQYQLIPLDTITLDASKATGAAIGLPILFGMLNNGTQNIDVGDSVFFILTFNESPPVTIPFVVSETVGVIEIDSIFALIHTGYTIPRTAVKEGKNANHLCIEVSRIVYSGVSTPISETPNCSNFTLTGVTTGIVSSVFEDVKMYPNPVRENLKIENLNDITDVSIYNVMGQVVRTLPSVMGSIEIDMSGLANGLYFVKMQNGQSIRTEKIQVVR